MLCRTYMGGVFSPLLASFVGVYLQRFIIVLFPGSHVPGNKTTKDLCTLLYISEVQQFVWFRRFYFLS